MLCHFAPYLPEVKLSSLSLRHVLLEHHNVHGRTPVFSRGYLLLRE